MEMEMEIVQVPSNDKLPSGDQYLLRRPEYDLLEQAPLKLKEKGSLYETYPWTLMTLAEAEKNVKAYNDTISDSWAQLHHILERREAALRKRWLKKTKEQRTRILLAAWPGMPKKHRPDFQAILKDNSPTATPSSAIIATALFKWPSINLEDLACGKTLLLFLNSRGRNSPEVFALTDLVSTRAGRGMMYLRVVGLAGFYMVLTGDVSRGTYGRIVPVQPSEHSSAWHFDAGDGLLILEIQAKILTFLIRCCHQIFHDISPEEISSTTLPVQPLPEPLATNSTSYLQMTEAAAEAPYKAPTNLDTNRLVQLIEARRMTAEEHVWDLREDPGYIATIVSDVALHLKEREILHTGRTDPSHAPKYWREALWFTVDEAYGLLTLWDTLYQLASKLHTSAGVRLADLDPTEPLPDDLLTVFSELTSTANGLKTCFSAALNMRVSTSPDIRRHLSKANHALRQDMGKFLQYLKAEADESLLLFSFIFNKAHEDDLRAVGIETVVDELQRVFDKDSQQRNRLTDTSLMIFSDLALITHILKETASFSTWTSRFRSETGFVSKVNSSNGDGTRIRRTLRPLTNPSSPEFILVGLSVPSAKDLYYPSEKARTQSNVKAMRTAERNLDEFWARVDNLFQREHGETLHQIFQRLSRSSREIKRTAPWQARESPSMATSVAPDLSHLAIVDEQGERPVVQQPRTKVKTRGSPLPMQETNATQEPPAPNDVGTPAVNNLTKRALKVFRTMFHTTSNDGQGEVDWKDFLHAMTAMGFAAEKLYGSVWHFTPTETAGGRSINVHEPHPTGKIPFYTARRIGGRLSRTYGWTGEMFTSD
ncbi:hypothetical protein PV11_07288 [Exophiala sideris]|uniref:EF-hand domain-containing protein n=1 Tax=Exophiala sideris TaxID=1016849 RepID=A0A0D1YY39_9EURO|nr:hypothetical protein PV11_07288 [Exophiala sideris]